MRFCDPKRVVINRRGTTRLDLSGSSNSEELHRIIAPFTYTILREEALPELPKVRFMHVLTDHPNAAEYRVAAETCAQLREAVKQPAPVDPGAI